MKIFFILFTLLISTAASAFNENHNTDELIGHVYDVKTNTLIYKETHNYLLVDGGKVMHSLFTSPSGETIAKREIEYENDKLVSYRLVQDSIEYEESIKVGNKNIQLEKRNQKQVSQKKIKTLNEIIIDAGFSDYIVNNWGALIEGATLKFDFASVSQMNKIRLQVKGADIDKTSAKEYLTDDEIVMFKMTIANPVLKMFIKPIEVGYYKESRQLAYYKGISNIKNSNGKQYSLVRIEYPQKNKIL